MNVIVGSARIDENGNICNGKAGDQTGREVCLEPFYVHIQGWVILRPRSEAVAIKIANTMKSACANNNIGYDQYQRNTLYEAGKHVNFDASKVKTPCETDCSALVRFCLASAGIFVGDFNTSSERGVLLASGKFIEKTFKSVDDVRTGDVLVTKTKGHTVIVVEDGKAEVKSGKVKGIYYTTGDLYLREEAGVSNKYIVVMPKGTKVVCNGNFKKVDSTKWLYVSTEVKGKTYKGYCSSKYLSNRKG